MNETFHLTPAELKAVTEHKRRMEGEANKEVSLEVAIVDFLGGYRRRWLAEKQHHDNAQQIEEINRYKWYRSEEEQHDIGLERAVMEWSDKYAGIWRAERESLEKNGFLSLTVSVVDPMGLHLRPTSHLVTVLNRFTCDVYVSKQGMPFYNFLMQGKPYMNVKSILGFLSLGIIGGDELEFLATGPDAMAALAAIRDAVGRRYDGAEYNLLTSQAAAGDRPCNSTGVADDTGMSATSGKVSENGLGG